MDFDREVGALMGPDSCAESIPELALLCSLSCAPLRTRIARFNLSYMNIFYTKRSTYWVYETCLGNTPPNRCRCEPSIRSPIDATSAKPPRCQHAQFRRVIFRLLDDRGRGEGHGKVLVPAIRSRLPVRTCSAGVVAYLSFEEEEG